MQILDKLLKIQTAFDQPQSYSAEGGLQETAMPSSPCSNQRSWEAHSESSDSPADPLAVCLLAMLCSPPPNLSGKPALCPCTAGRPFQGIQTAQQNPFLFVFCLCYTLTCLLPALDPSLIVSRPLYTLYGVGLSNSYAPNSSMRSRCEWNLLEAELVQA